MVKLTPLQDLRALKYAEKHYPEGPTVEEVVEQVSRAAKAAPHGGAVYVAHQRGPMKSRDFITVIPHSGWQFPKKYPRGARMTDFMGVYRSGRGLKDQLLRNAWRNYMIWNMTSDIIVLAPRRPVPKAK